MYIVLETYTDASRNDYNQTFIVDNRKTAVKLGNALIKAFVKTEILDGWDASDIKRTGSLESANYKEAWNEKHAERVTIQEATIVKDFKLAEKVDRFGKFFEVEITKKIA